MSCHHLGSLRHAHFQIIIPARWYEMVRGLGPQITSSTSTSRYESNDRGTSDMPTDSDETQPASPSHSTSSRVAVVPHNDHISYAPDGRVILYRSRGDNLFPTSTVRGAATAAFKQKQVLGGYNWKNVSNDMKETYWGELQKACCWDEKELSTSFVRDHWDKVAAKAYKDFVCGVKTKFEKGHLHKIKGVRPNVLESWKKQWEKPQKPEVKAKSEIAKMNRRSGPDGPGTGPVIHHGGSRNAELHALDEAKAKGIAFEHTGLATHYRLHCVNGVWTDARAKYIYDETIRRVNEEKRPLPGEVEEREVPPSRVEEIL